MKQNALSPNRRCVSQPPRHSPRRGISNRRVSGPSSKAIPSRRNASSCRRSNCRTTTTKWISPARVRAFCDALDTFDFTAVTPIREQEPPVLCLVFYGCVHAYTRDSYKKIVRRKHRNLQYARTARRVRELAVPSKDSDRRGFGFRCREHPETISVSLRDDRRAWISVRYTFQRRHAVIFYVRRSQSPAERLTQRRCRASCLSRLKFPRERSSGRDVV